MDSAKKALVIGNHPIRQNIIDQAQAKGHPVNVFNSFADIPDDYDYCDLFVLPEQGISDEDTLQSLEALAQRFPETGPAAPKPICHLLLHDQISLWLLQTWTSMSRFRESSSYILSRSRTNGRKT